MAGSKTTQELIVEHRDLNTKIDGSYLPNGEIKPGVNHQVLKKLKGQRLKAKQDLTGRAELGDSKAVAYAAEREQVLAAKAAANSAAA